ncbi:MAG: hypothetical protein ACI4BI_05610, partial [Anaerotardibacter sp.]
MVCKSDQLEAHKSARSAKKPLENSLKGSHKESFEKSFEEPLKAGQEFINAEARKQFIENVYDQGRVLYRDLPWRYIDDPYHVLVSEVMLQQTQVSRVMKYWQSFITLFPTIDALAAADTSLVLEMWQGLGYNRRALMLKRCAEICSQDY